MPSRAYLIRTFLLIAALLFVPAGVAFAQEDPTVSNAVRKWESFDFTARTIRPADVQSLTLDDLKFLRGIVFGRHGRVFKDQEIAAYLQSRPWYKANPAFNNSVLTETERRNLDVIRDAEARLHPQLQPGDMRFYRARPLTQKKLGEHTGGEWTVLAAEVEAIHGKRFDDTPWLQQYFDERYWYQPADRYDPKLLTDIERKNLALINTAHKRQRHVALSPGDMELFENKLLTEQMLHGLSLHELRLLRNEVYARHGRVFQTPWLQQYFSEQPWYQASDTFHDEELSGADKENVLLIVKYENGLHDELGTRRISPSLLDGLFLEDARQMRDEIYARHGKVFKNSWTQKYFSSFDWYHADPGFTEASLSPVEKQNLATIAAYEKRAVTAMSTIEG